MLSLAPVRRRGFPLGKMTRSAFSFQTGKIPHLEISLSIRLRGEVAINETFAVFILMSESAKSMRERGRRRFFSAAQ